MILCKEIKQGNYLQFTKLNKVLLNMTKLDDGFG